MIKRGDKHLLPLFSLFWQLYYILGPFHEPVFCVFPTRCCQIILRPTCIFSFYACCCCCHHHLISYPEIINAKLIIRLGCCLIYQNTHYYLQYWLLCPFVFHPQKCALFFFFFLIFTQFINENAKKLQNSVTSLHNLCPGNRVHALAPFESG